MSIDSLCCCLHTDDALKKWSCYMKVHVGVLKPEKTFRPQWDSNT